MMDSFSTGLTMNELNASALERFIYKQVDENMIHYLADAAHNVIQCDPAMMPPLAPDSRHRTVSREARCDDGGIPPLYEFITQLVISSNVQVPTLMSTLVYLNRLKSRLQPMAKGLRCTTHRIFLAALILSAKYLNDSSPKNKHWSNYSVIASHGFNFGFSRTEVNLMEKQLLFLLDWDLRITEEDLYRELDFFLVPIRRRIERRRLQRLEKELRQLEELQQVEAERERQSWATAASQRYASESPEALRSSASSWMLDASPPGLEYSSGASYTSSDGSGATTPVSDHEDMSQLYADMSTAVYDGTMEHVLEDAQYQPTMSMKAAMYHQQSTTQHVLPCEIDAEELHAMDVSRPAKSLKGFMGRVFGAGHAVR